MWHVTVYLGLYSYYAFNIVELSSRFCIRSRV